MLESVHQDEVLSSFIYPRLMIPISNDSLINRNLAHLQPRTMVRLRSFPTCVYHATNHLASKISPAIVQSPVVGTQTSHCVRPATKKPTRLCRFEASFCIHQNLGYKYVREDSLGVSIQQKRQLGLPKRQ